ncbi:protease inhibitor I42 family protein [Deinococcus apachensis]|uniref:protease inhibitor I42 family protein n=1 Tax=Deinococcus apachensis TaxID=309886 RepID=UPI000378517F|nr:protease inhibitor I42 family protein [Deinococcus apachensis]
MTDIPGRFAGSFGPGAEPPPGARLPARWAAPGVLGLALLLGACAPVAGPGGTAPPAPAVPTRPVPKTIRLDQAANGSIVDLRVGDTLELSLPGNPSTGYAWSPNLTLGTVVQPLGGPGFRPSGTGLGAAGEVILRYRAVQAGQFLLSLTYGRSFEPLPPNPPTFQVFLFVR